MVYLSYTFILLFITEGSQGKELKQDMNLEAGAELEAMEESCLLAFFLWFTQFAFL